MHTRNQRNLALPVLLWRWEIELKQRGLFGLHGEKGGGRDGRRGLGGGGHGGMFIYV